MSKDMLFSYFQHCLESDRAFVKLLRFSGWSFRFPLDWQISLYLQKPSARAVLPKERWAQTFQRDVNDNAVGIRLRRNGRETVVYDVSDTSPMPGTNMAVPLWEVPSSDADSHSDTYEEEIDAYVFENIVHQPEDLLRKGFEENEVSRFAFALASSAKFSAAMRCGLNEPNPDDVTTVLNTLSGLHVSPETLYDAYCTYFHQALSSGLSPIRDLAVSRGMTRNATQDVSDVPVKDTSPVLEPHEDAPAVESNNYVITEDFHLGTPSQRFQNNLEAIRVLKQIESEHRPATRDEQDVLARYVGWGGLSEYFGEDKNGSSELQELLSDEEYEEARASTLTSFYTPITVIRSLYAALERMGFHGGRILEPGCGVGHFFGALPSSLRGSKLTGVEIDSLSARIAQFLYPDANILHSGFEQTYFPDDYFDLVVGNVPFGNFSVYDPEYSRQNFLIHDYFFAKAMDKVRPGGIVALLSSTGTMDKSYSSLRSYLFARADLLGAIRLPAGTFAENAGTNIAADLLLLQKRDGIDYNRDHAEWVDGAKEMYNSRWEKVYVNAYFNSHREMILGDLRRTYGRYGVEATCVAPENFDLGASLDAALSNIPGTYSARVEKPAEISPAVEEPDVPDIDRSDLPEYSYIVRDGKVYYNEPSGLTAYSGPENRVPRLIGLIEIRDCVRQLLRLQVTEPDEYLAGANRAELNRLYNHFVQRYGPLNNPTNRNLFRADNSAPLLLALESYDPDTKIATKEDIFTKRTVRFSETITSVETAEDALALSLAERTQVDLSYMSALSGKSEEELLRELAGRIFLNPEHQLRADAPEYLDADSYLSGNVVEKLKTARVFSQQDSAYLANVEALEAVQPDPLDAAQIFVRLGTPWIPAHVVQQFIVELLELPEYAKERYTVSYEPILAEWEIDGRSYVPENALTTVKYGTKRINALDLLYLRLNQKEIVVNNVGLVNGERVPVRDVEETALANSRADDLDAAFREWIWKDDDRRRSLVSIYNEKYNAYRDRVYDGSHLNFPGLNPNIELRPYQKDAVARILYSGNTLLAHEVGAGKTLEMIVAAQESKRLGLCNKSMIVVPNNIVDQWANEYLNAYPNANVLIVRPEDAKAENRKVFASRIAMGRYDAIIIGQTQFERIPLSISEQIAQNTAVLNEVIEAIEEWKSAHQTVKSLERLRNRYRKRIEALNDVPRDDVITFEELGVDRLFVDEAHYFKNCPVLTKMNNVAGLSTAESKRANDLLMKVRYLDEHGGATIFATGTPVSNSMVELYTMQRYLQYSDLEKLGLSHFDAWAAQYAEPRQVWEIAPEGTKFRSTTRLAYFHNLPELMTLFRRVADIKTSSALNLDIPAAVRETVVTPPSELQLDMIQELGARADKIHNRSVSPDEDNMLRVTSDGRKLALDPRLLNPDFSENENSKVAACAEKVFEIWNDTQALRLTQLVFCDLSVPHGKSEDCSSGKFSNIYDDLKIKLLTKGIPESEIAYIHDAKNDRQFRAIVDKFRAGSIRVLLGSTQKLGTGTNVQDRVIAMHHLDCPWRPSDLTQRDGRGIRNGNINRSVQIYTYVTEKTFDSFLYQTVERKQRFCGQIMTDKSPLRSAEDVDEVTLSYAEIKALVANDPIVQEKMELDVTVQRLKMEKDSYLENKHRLQDKIAKVYPVRIPQIKLAIQCVEADAKTVQAHPLPDGKEVEISIFGKTYTDRKEASKALAAAIKATSEKETVIGTYRGLTVLAERNEKSHFLFLHGAYRYLVGDNSFLTTKNDLKDLQSCVESIPARIVQLKQDLVDQEHALELAKREVNVPFAREQEMQDALRRQAELLDLLSDNSHESDLAAKEKPAEKMSMPHVPETEKSKDSLSGITAFVEAFGDPRGTNDERGPEMDL